DGKVEVIAINDDKQVEAVDGATGQTEWVSNAFLDNTYPHIIVADIYADGEPEVIADNSLINGTTGELIWQTYLPELFLGRMPAVGDINLDGRQEIIIGNRCLNPDGSIAWESSIMGDYGHWAAILNYDGDIQGEVAMIGAGYLGFYDPDGTELYKTNAGTGQPGPPCVADFDGDGTAEIAWASSSLFNMFELDGSIRWTASISDSSGLASCSGYDIDGDGAYEALFADENQFYIFDGSQGSVLFSQSGHASGTIFEYPIVADIDNDDSAEILISSNNFRQSNPNGWAGVTVFGHVGEGWAKSGPTWNVHDFAVTNIYPDGGIPSSPEPPWLIHNVYRARPTEDAKAIDLFAEISDLCYAGCEENSIVRVAAELSNQGFSSIREDIPLSLFRKDGSSLTFITQSLTEERIDAGQRGSSVEFETTYASIQGADALVVRADDWGSGFGVIDECDEWNNGIEFTPPPCE
ncbi:MAG: VCBS repeat-containing protein, partial [Myxococcota bacterium]|nr:VCBS repeat-containing protein [Myxococcota bacterium]